MFVQKLLLILGMGSVLLLVAVLVAMFGPFGWVIDLVALYLMFLLVTNVIDGDGFADPLGYKKADRENKRKAEEKRLKKEARKAAGKKWWQP